MDTKKVFTCVGCGKKYSMADVKNADYFPSTGMCSGCYEKRCAVREERDCFGKPPAYDPKSNECGFECPDRSVCRVYVITDKDRKVS